MKRRVFASIGVLAAALATGCGHSAAPRPVRPPPASEPSTRADPSENDIPKLIAPPPAYGNKVVMAKRPARSPHN